MLGVYKYYRQSRAWLTVKYTFPNLVKSVTERFLTYFQPPTIITTYFPNTCFNVASPSSSWSYLWMFPYRFPHPLMVKHCPIQSAAIGVPIA